MRDMRALKRVAPDVIAPHLIVQVAGPVHVHRAGDVPGGVEQRVFVRLDDANLRIGQVLGDPVGRDEHVGIGVVAIEDLRHIHKSISCVRGERKGWCRTMPDPGAHGHARAWGWPGRKAAFGCMFTG